MLHACFALLGDLIEEEGGTAAVTSYADDLRNEPDPNVPDGLQEKWASWRDEALYLWHWWKVIRPDRHAREQHLLTSLFGDRASRVFSEPDPETGLAQYLPPQFSEEEEKRYAEFRALEEQNEKDDQTMLHRLIDIRESLWT